MGARFSFSRIPQWHKQLQRRCDWRRWTLGAAVAARRTSALVAATTTARGSPFRPRPFWSPPEKAPRLFCASDRPTVQLQRKALRAAASIAACYGLFCGKHAAQRFVLPASIGASAEWGEQIGFCRLLIIRQIELYSCCVSKCLALFCFLRCGKISFFNECSNCVSKD